MYHQWWPDTDGIMGGERVCGILKEGEFGQASIVGNKDTRESGVESVQ